MRLFIAIPLPSTIQEQLGKIQQEIGGGLGLRFVQAGSIHLTLKFLGEVSEELVPRIIKQLNTISANSFSCTLADIGFFPSKKDIKVVWVGIKEENRVQALFERVEHVLEPLFQKDTRFKAHITLARVKHIKNPEQFQKRIATITVTPLKWKVDRIVLMKSELTNEGPLYSELHAVPLRQ